MTAASLWLSGNDLLAGEAELLRKRAAEQGVIFGDVCPSGFRRIELHAERILTRPAVASPASATTRSCPNLTCVTARAYTGGASTSSLLSQEAVMNAHPFSIRVSRASVLCWGVATAALAGEPKEGRELFEREWLPLDSAATVATAWGQCSTTRRAWPATTKGASEVVERRARTCRSSLPSNKAWISTPPRAV